MTSRPTAVERAFELASSGDVTEIDDIRRQLVKEGYDSVIGHLAGPQIQRQLRDLMKSARREAEGSPTST